MPDLESFWKIRSRSGDLNVIYYGAHVKFQCGKKIWVCSESCEIVIEPLNCGSR